MVSESARDEDFETVLDFDNWQRNDWDIQGQKHLIFAMAKVTKFKLRDCIFSNFTTIFFHEIFQI